MADPEHEAVVRKGAKVIREWRRRHPEEHLNLRGADLRLLNLTGADLSGANLDHADLSGGHLREANLSGALLLCTDLYSADLARANLSGAFLTMTNLLMTNLNEADLVKAELNYVNLVLTNLVGANLNEASLSNSNIRRAFFRDADLRKARLTWTSITGCNLAEAKGLETIQHNSPSSIGVDTLMISFRSAGNKFTPELRTFFLNAGVPVELLEELPRIISRIKYYSVFVAYGEPDREFAMRLTDDLKAKGVQCWLYPTDYTAGERTWHEIGQKRKESEKMIVICSARSLIRDGLLKEIEEQVDEDPDKMIPVSLDPLWQEKGFLVMRAGRDFKPFLLDKNYVNFHSEVVYEKSLEKLLKGLRLKESP